MAKSSSNKRFLIGFVVFLFLLIAGLIFDALTNRYITPLITWPWLVGSISSFLVLVSWVIKEIIVGFLKSFGGLGISSFWSRYKEQKESASSKLSAVFVIEELGKLWKLQPPFIENLPAGKFIEKSVTLKHVVTQELYFDEKHVLTEELNDSSCNIFILYGKAGAGKSSYLLWNIYCHFKSGVGKFKNIVFLRPDLHHQWKEELTHFKAQNTLLVIDAFKREQEKDEVIFGEGENRCKVLNELVTAGFQDQDHPFKVIITMRVTEFKDFSESGLVQKDTIYSRKVSEEMLDFDQIVKKKIENNDVENEVDDKDWKFFLKALSIKSEGLPFYITHMFNDLKSEDNVLSLDVFYGYPKGMMNLICETVHKGLQDDIRESEAISFLLLLFLDTNVLYPEYSRHFIDFTIQLLSPDESYKRIQKRFNNFVDIWFQNTGSIGDLDIDGQDNTAMSSHWKSSLLSALEHPELVEDEYREIIHIIGNIRERDYNSLKEKVINELTRFLGKGFVDNADCYLCIDLAKLGEKALKKATDDIFLVHKSTSELPDRYIDLVQVELSELWITYAWEYREQRDIEKVIECYDYALGVDKLEGKSHTLQFHAYANYLVNHVLKSYQSNSQKYEECVAKIERLYEKAPNDSTTCHTRAIFYGTIGKIEEADKSFRRALELGEKEKEAFNHTRVSYANFLMHQGNRLPDRVKNQEPHIIKARRLLESYIDDTNPVSPIPFRILGRLYYRFWDQDYVKGEVSKWEKGLEYLERSSVYAEKIPLQKSKTEHEKAKLYINWANASTGADKKVKLNLALEAAQNAMTVSRCSDTETYFGQVLTTYDRINFFLENE